jgi:hypothetical protein
MSTPKDPLDLMTPEQREWFNKHVSIQTPEQQARPIKFARVEEEAEKPETLTEAERATLADWWDDNDRNSSMNALFAEVARIKAAARREALLEAKRALLAQAATISDEPVTAFGVADLYQMGRKDGYKFGAGVVAHLDDSEDRAEEQGA